MKLFDVHSHVDAVELFCGIGGFTIAMKVLADQVEKINHIGLDNERSALIAYRAFTNEPSRYQDLSDVDATIEKILLWRIGVDSIPLTIVPPYFDGPVCPNERRRLIVMGGSPCPDFSQAGRRQEGDRANLTINMMQIAIFLRADVVIMENVRECYKTDTFAAAKALMVNAGYVCEVIVLNALQCKTPQTRIRGFAIFVPTKYHERLRQSIAITVAELRMTSHVTNMRNALPNLRWNQPLLFKVQSFGSGEGIRAINIDQGVAPTLMAYNYACDSNDDDMKGAEPTARYPTADEMLALQSFPCSFNHHDTRTLPLYKKIRLAGNAVPPTMVEKILEIVKRI